ncbi:hypothetical protein ACIQPR_09940 [Streptomyces sp. NPDC091280]|uniref:hypothetical protein n=1 Tax=Streptomyces sp. NPDC091280 TaxID=3365984 RepID=UPI00380314FD
MSGTYHGPVLGQGTLNHYNININIYREAAAQADIPEADALYRRLHNLQGAILKAHRATGAAPRVRAVFGQDRLVPHPDLRLAPELIAGGTGIRRPTGSAGPSGPQLLVERFEAADCRMLLAGGSGAGKTEQLFLIAETLQARAAAALNGESDEKNPAQISIPVVVPLKGLNEPRATGLDYVLHYITHILGLGGANRNQVARWITTGRITLLIDGLDTLPSEQHAPFVEGLNKLCVANESWDVRLLVTTRRDEYLSHGLLLNLQEAVELQPLTTAQLHSALGQGASPAGQQALDRLKMWSVEAPEAATLLSRPLAFTIHALIAAEGGTPASRVSALGIPWADYLHIAIDADAAEIPDGVNPDSAVCLSFLTWCAERLRASEGKVLPAQVPQEWLTPDLLGVYRWRMLVCGLPLFLYSAIAGWLVIGPWGAVCGVGLTVLPSVLSMRWFSEYREVMAGYEANQAGSEVHRRTRLRFSVWTPVLAAAGGGLAYAAQRFWPAVSRSTWVSAGTFNWAWIAFGCLAGLAVGLAGNHDARRLLIDGPTRGDFDLSTLRPLQLARLLSKFAAGPLVFVTFLGTLPGIMMLVVGATVESLGAPAPGAHIPWILDAFLSMLREIHAAGRSAPLGDLYPHPAWLGAWVALGVGWTVLSAVAWFLQVHRVLPLKEALLREEGALPGPWRLTLTFLRDHGLLRDSCGYYEFVHDDLLDYLQGQTP